MDPVKTRRNDSRFPTQADNGLSQFKAQFEQRVSTQILEFNVFEILPDAFGGIQIRCVAGQLNQMNSFGSPCAQKGFGFSTPMGG